MDGYKFPSEPVANPESTITGANYRFTLINDVVLRYEWSEDGVFEDRASTFAINRKFPKPDFRLQDEADKLQILTPSFHLTYDKQRFSSGGLIVAFTSKLTEWGSEWRYGKAPEANLGGTARTLDCVDGRCDMGTGILSRFGFSALDDSESILFDGKGFVAGRRPGDRIDGYLFAYGNDYKKAMKAFFAVSGSQPAVPRWCLGNWWSRYYAYSSSEYLSLMDEFKAKDIPLSVAVIDMDWHTVKGDDIPHAGWTGYTWNKDLFPEPESFMRSLHERGLKITLNDHPHAGIHVHEDLYEETARTLGHDTTNGAPILFDAASPEFMNAYLNVVHRKIEDQGCDFWWIDWQQGSISSIPGLDPLWVLNHFQYIHHKQDKEKGQPLIFSRYAGPGSHRYPVGFSGDSFATWDSLKFQPEFTATASNIGYGWWSHDIGGHLAGCRDDEMAVRWIQFGAFSPILRLHSSLSRWMSKEPWRYRPESEEAMRNFLQLRHRLVPYIYSVTTYESRSDEPLVQPMYWAFPSRDTAYRFPNQYYFGPNLVVSPAVTPRDKRTNRSRTQVWVPPGRHVDVLTGFVYDGDREIDMYRSLRQIPILAAEGSIIPLDQEPVPANGCGNPEAFEILVVIGKSGHFSILEDARDDPESELSTEELRLIEIEYDQASGRLTAPSAGRAWTFRFISLLETPSPIRVLRDGVVSTGQRVTVHNFPGLPNTTIELPKVENPESIITIELGSNPQLSVLDYTPPLSALVEDYQTDNDMKDRIWGVIEAAQPTAVKITRLISLGLEEAIAGPILELLLSDSRTNTKIAT